MAGLHAEAGKRDRGGQERAVEHHHCGCKGLLVPALLLASLGVPATASAQGAPAPAPAPAPAAQPGSSASASGASGGGGGWFDANASASAPPASGPSLSATGSAPSAEVQAAGAPATTGPEVAQAEQELDKVEDAWVARQRQLGEGTTLTGGVGLLHMQHAQGAAPAGFRVEPL